MRKGRDGKRKEKRKEKKKEKKEKKEKNGVFSGHYVIASSLPPKRLRPKDDHWNATRSCQFLSQFNMMFIKMEFMTTIITIIFLILSCNIELDPQH